ncbi:MAG: hypothetical protein WDO14_02250 [Bacteroidota bacterium]
MKLNIIPIIVGAFIITTNAFSQNIAVTNDELIKYATVIDSVGRMQNTARHELGDMIRSKGIMDLARYNALNKIINDPPQLEEAKATPEEIAFVKEVNAKQEEEVGRIKSTYQELATNYVTPQVFNKVRKAIDTDPQIKKRYDSLVMKIQNNPGQ